MPSCHLLINFLGVTFNINWPDRVVLTAALINADSRANSPPWTSDHIVGNGISAVGKARGLPFGAWFGGGETRHTRKFAFTPHLWMSLLQYRMEITATPFLRSSFSIRSISCARASSTHSLHGLQSHKAPPHQITF